MSFVQTKIANGGSEYPVWDKSAHSAISGIEDTLSNSGTWNETYSAVSSNSANWGGSALPISAGDGIAINVVDGTLVISATGGESTSQCDILWGNGSTAWTKGNTITLSQPKSAYHFIAVETGGGYHRIFQYGSEATNMFANPNFQTTTYWFQLSASLSDATHLYYNNASTVGVGETNIMYVYGLFKK